MSFDAATIATIHQFCQLVLRSLGVAGDTDAGRHARRGPRAADRARSVDDLYLARFGREQKPPWTRAAGARRSPARSSATRGPGSSPPACSTEAPDSPAAMRVRFASEVLDEVERRKRRLGVLSYDDLLSQLADALEPTTTPPPARGCSTAGSSC